MKFDEVVAQGNESCIRCGECLTKCQYISISGERAVLEIKNLRDGKEVKLIDRECISCFSCETYCPNDAHPYLAILYRKHKLYHQNGVSDQVLYMLHAPKKNFRKDALNYMKPEAKALVDQWKKNEDKTEFDEVVYPGCNLLTTPMLATNGLFDDVPIAGSLERCCGEMYFRLGLIDHAERIAKQLEKYYAGKKIKKMIFICPAGFHMFSRVMPKFFGVHFDFEKEFIANWFLKKIKSGDFEIKDKVEKDFVIHDSCHARVMGKDFLGSIRTLITELGGNIIETNGNEGKCCGVAAAARSHTVLDVFKIAHTAMKDYPWLSKTKTMAYCTGCSLTLTLTGLVLPRSVPVLHLLQLLTMAKGQNNRQSMRYHAFPAARALIVHGLPLLLSRSRNYLELSELNDSRNESLNFKGRV